MVTRSQFNEFLKSVNLSDLETRKQINSMVIDEVIEQNHMRQFWEVNGFPPLDTSIVKFLRPCPVVVYGLNGWEVRFNNQWFCD